MNDLPPTIDELRLDDLHEMADQAEEVRAYLVNLRGGAPFLSGTDSQLLHGWLTGGVPVSVILASMDRVAVRRRRCRTHGRLSLFACQAEVRRMMGRRTRPSSAPPPRPPGTLSGLGLLAGQIRAMTIAPGFAPYRDRLAQDLVQLDQNTDPCRDREELARQAISACRRFHEAIWDAIYDQRPALLHDAEGELDALRGLLRGAAWDAAVEEVARDRVRARFPLVSAQVIWDRVQESPPLSVS